MSYIPPNRDRWAFHCPHCYAYAHQRWISTVGGQYDKGPDTATFNTMLAYSVSRCSHCNKYAIWYEEKMIYPNYSIAPLPEEDMPDEIKNDFEDARQVLTISSRSSAALLRLAVEKLCIHLGYSGDNINQAIGKMVADGLDPLVQQAFDTVRVIGNEAVHPGQIDLRDDPDTALQLFNLVNFIVREKISKPRQIQEIYNKLPQSKLQQIEQRDKKSKST